MTGASHERRAPVGILSEVLGPCRPFGQLCTACAVLLHGFDNGGGDTTTYHHRERWWTERVTPVGRKGQVPGTGVLGGERRLRRGLHVGYLYHHLPPPREVVGREGDAGRAHRPSARHGSAG